MEERRQSFATFSLPGNIRSRGSPSVWGLPSTWTEATSGSTLMAAQEDREGYKVKQRIYLKLPSLYSVIKITFGQNYWFSLWLIQCVKFKEKIIFTFPSFWRPPIRPRLSDDSVLNTLCTILRSEREKSDKTTTITIYLQYSLDSAIHTNFAPSSICFYYVVDKIF